MKKVFAPVSLIMALLFLAACSTSPVMRLYDGPEKPESEVTVVRVPVELEVLSINGRRIKGLNTLFSPGYKDLHLDPGEYRILAYYKDLWSINADTHDVIKSDPALFPVDGKAGHFYELGFDEPDNIEQARELEAQFSGHVLNVTTGEETPSRASGVAFRSGIIGSLADFAGADSTTEADAEQAESGQQVIAPVARKDKGEENHSEQSGAEESPDEDSSGYLDMLKAYWSQATPEERRAFLRWVSEQE